VTRARAATKINPGRALTRGSKNRGEPKSEKGKSEVVVDSCSSRSTDRRPANEQSSCGTHSYSETTRGDSRALSFTGKMSTACCSWVSASRDPERDMTELWQQNELGVREPTGIWMKSGAVPGTKI
jgi:hypothetical protein